jgi:hypothetical protein
MPNAVVDSADAAVPYGPAGRVVSPDRSDQAEPADCAAAGLAEAAGHSDSPALAGAV